MTQNNFGFYISSFLIRVHFFDADINGGGGGRNMKQCSRFFVDINLPIWSRGYIAELGARGSHLEEAKQFSILQNLVFAHFPLLHYWKICRRGKNYFTRRKIFVTMKFSCRWCRKKYINSLSWRVDACIDI